MDNNKANTISLQTNHSSKEHPFNWLDVPPVFIIGCPRSGTTLLRVMLTLHPTVSISSEGAYISCLRSRIQDQADITSLALLNEIHDEVVQFLVSEKFLTIPSFRDLMTWTRELGVNLRSLITFYGTWEARVLEKKRLSWWGDNAPYHAHHIPFFASLFTRSKFILMIRDPRDTCASSKTSLSNHALDKAISEWESVLLAALLAQQFLGSERFVQLRYEDLVRDPVGQLRMVCRFLDVEYADQMLHFCNSPCAKATSRLAHHQNLRRPVFSTSIGRFRRVLTADETETIEQRLHTPMMYYGYLASSRYDEIACGVLQRRVRE